MIQRYAALLLTLAALACSRPDESVVGSAGQPARARRPATEAPAPVSPSPAEPETAAEARPGGTAADAAPAAEPTAATTQSPARSQFASRSNSLAPVPAAPANETVTADKKVPVARAAVAGSGRKRPPARQQPRSGTAWRRLETTPELQAEGVAVVSAPNGLDTASGLPAPVAKNSSTETAELENESGWGGLPGPPTQVFRLRAGLDTTVLSVRGTTLALPANAFAYEDDSKQAAVTGTVVVRLREFYTVADMVLQQLHTAAGTQLLETGGMLQLTARTPDGRSCRLRPGASVLVRVPAPRPVADMQLFAGVASSRGRIDWRRPRRALNPRRLRQIAPYFRNGMSLRAFLGKRMRCSEATARLLRRSPLRMRGRTWYRGERLRITAQWRATILIDSLGVVTGVRQRNAPAPELSAALETAVAQLPPFQPAYLVAPVAPGKRPRNAPRPARLSMRSAIPVWLSVTKRGRVLVYTDRGSVRLPLVARPAVSSAEARQRLAMPPASDDTPAQLGGYLFAAAELGWLNCDRYYQVRPPQTLFTVSGTRADDVVCVVFRNVRGVLAGVPDIGGHVFGSLPAQEPITVVVLRRRGTQNEIALQQGTVAALNRAPLTFQPTTTEQIQAALAKLNDSGNSTPAGALSSR